MPFDPTAWQQAAEGTRDLEAPPDNEYEAELVDKAVITARADGRQSIKLTWRVLAGPQRDAQWSTLYSLEQYNRDGEPSPALSITVQNLKRMGLETEGITDADELDEALAPLVGRAFTVRVKRSGSFTNTDPQAPLDNAQPSLAGTGYGEAPRNGPTSAIIGDDRGGLSAPAAGIGLDTRAGLRRDTERTGESDVPAPEAGEFQPPAAGDDVPWEGDEPPKQGDTNPATGKPFEW